MLDIIVNMSRYIYLIVILVLFVLTVSERGKKDDGREFVFKYQQVLILIFHVLSMTTLTLNYWNSDNKELMIKVLILSTITLLVAIILINVLLKQSNILIWNIIMFFIDIGIVCLGRLELALCYRQLIWVVIAAGVAIALLLLYKIDIKYINLTILYQVLSIGLLILPFFFGSRINGSLNWVSIYGIKFQPSELVKILLVFYLASVYSKKFKFTNLIISSVTVAICLIILFVQKDLGAALILFMIYLFMMYYYTKREVLFITGLVSAIGASYLAYSIFGHVRYRVETWLNPWKYIDDRGYQVTQSLFAIVGGGWIGTGLTKGLSTKVPNVTTDFIFTEICEEFGNIFSILLIGLYLLMFLSIVDTALKSKSKFHKNLVLGLGIGFGFQAFFIIGGVIKLIPLTGVTLPFISYGGSSLLVNIILITLVQIITIKDGQKIENTR